MAVRADANGDELRISSGLPANVNNFTVTFWVMRVGNGGNWSCLWNIDNGGTNDYIYLENNGSAGDASYDLWTGVSDSNIITNAVTLTNDVWHFVAITKAGNTHTVYEAAVSSATISSQNASQSNSFTPGNISFAESPWSSEWFNGRIAAMKFWDGVALSASQVAAERWRILPVHHGNLYAWWPMFGGATERLRDYSGNGHNWTAGGTLTDEAGPPVSWGQPWIIVPTFVSTGAETVLSTARGIGSAQNDAQPSLSISEAARGFSRSDNTALGFSALTNAGHGFGSARNKIAVTVTPILATALGFSGARNLIASLVANTASAYAVSGSQNDADPLTTTISTARGVSQGLGIANYYGGIRAHRILAHGQYWAALDAFTEGHYTAQIAVISSIARAYGGGLAIAIPDILQLTTTARSVGETRNKSILVPSLTNSAYGAAAARNLTAFLVNPLATALGQSGSQNDAQTSLDVLISALGQGQGRNDVTATIDLVLSAYGFSRVTNRALPSIPGFSAAYGYDRGRGSFIATFAIAVGASGSTRATNVATSSIALSNTAIGQGGANDTAAFLLDLIAIARGDSKGLGVALPADAPDSVLSAAIGQSRGRGSFISLTSIASGAIGQSSGLAGTLLSGIVYVVIGDYIILFPDTDIDVLFPDDEGDILFPDDEINILFGG